MNTFRINTNYFGLMLLVEKILLLNMLKIIVLVLATVAIVNVAGHGSMHDPVNRQSRWRYDDTAPKNYDDTGVHCGSYFVCNFV